MIYLEYLNEDLIQVIVSKLKFNDIDNFNEVVNIKDSTFRFLYSNLHPHVYNIIKDIFNLDKSISWKEHYMQLYESHLISVMCSKYANITRESLLINTDFLNFMDIKNLGTYKQLYDISSPGCYLIKLNINRHMCRALYSMYIMKLDLRTIPDFVIISILINLKHPENARWYQEILCGIEYIFDYSKIYFDTITKMLNIPIYPQFDDYYRDWCIELNITTWSKGISSKPFNFNCLKNLSSDMVESQYGKLGIYLKYIYDNFPSIVVQIDEYIKL